VADCPTASTLDALIASVIAATGIARRSMPFTAIGIIGAYAGRCVGSVRERNKLNVRPSVAKLQTELEADQLLDRIEKTVRYWNKQYSALERVAQDLARKMNIDPDYDIVLVNTEWLRRSNLKLTTFPNWLMASNEIRENFSFRKGARKR
jgi:hypothetical protein